jgi:hypothetical protein
VMRVAATLQDGPPSIVESRTESGVERDAELYSASIYIQNRAKHKPMINSRHTTWKSASGTIQHGSKSKKAVRHVQGSTPA